MARVLTPYRATKLAARQRARTRQRILFTVLGVFTLVAVLAAILVSGQLFHAENRITLMLKGESCLHHLGQIERALRAMSAVRSVDTTQLPGHVIVETGTASVKPDDLLSVIRMVKGSDWFCDADVM